ncbi:hypothetical protein ACFWBX_01425 [Streptomyces sp. NPDC059991]|uniref:hypothetical protein n=1 Tax=Streptomyces sp. NPDC059991 TaxID=3347028 RepID=UPI00367A4E52
MSDLAVATSLYYLLRVQPEVLKLVAVAAAIASLRCIRLGRAVWITTDRSRDIAPLPRRVL